MAQCLCFGGLLRGRGNDDDDDAAARRPRQTVPPRTSRLNLRRRLRASATQEENKSKIFSFGELAAATNNFSDDTVIGRGGFGPVYKGRLESGDVVAIKRLDNRGFQGNKEFLVEVLMLSLLRHPNLVQLIGYCAEGEQRLLVYDYFPLGALEDHIHDLLPRQQPLDWNTRMVIAAEAARGLNYLHNEARPCVIYRDLKTANILLDDGFHTKLSDFGFAKFGPTEGQSHVSTRVMGTHGYCAPEYAMTGRLTTKSDIYCFGVVLLELITGRKALDETRGGNEKYLAEWARSLARDRRNFQLMADPRLRGHFSVSTLKMAVEVAVMCVREQPANRPDSSELVQALDFISSRKYVPNDPRPRASTPKGEGSSSSSNPTQDSQRERDIAEARQWGETSREKMHQQHPDRQPQ